MADNISDFLEAKGHTLDFLIDGTTTLQHATSEEYNVIVLDVMLFGMDGFIVC